MTKIEMSDRLEAFVQDHPAGWDHQSWLGLLSALDQEGVDVSDSEQIGHSLEQTRLAMTLSGMGVRGLGPKRIQALVDRFGTLWSLRHASVEEISAIPNVPNALAEEVHRAIV